MNFELNEDLQAIRKVARSFALNEIAPTVDADDKAHCFRKDIVEKMGELGFLGCPIPEKYGGSEMGYLAWVIVAEEISRVHSSMRIPFNMQAGPALTLLRWGSEEMKEKYIPGLASGKKLCCFAITEPNAGSDVAAMKATAIKDGDYYVLNGTKTWISNAQVADLALVYAYTDPGVRVKGMSAFLIDMNTPGIDTASLQEKLGTWAAPTGEVIFENCRVPADTLIGKEGEGFKICMQQLSDTRLGCGAGALGVAQACLDTALEYANQREQFGQVIGKFATIQDMIAEMVVETEAARLMLYRAAWLKDQGVPCSLETSMAKYFAAETANHNADKAVKILGAYGYSEEYPVARLFRDAKLYQIVEGSSAIQKMIISQDALGYRKANR